MAMLDYQRVRSWNGNIWTFPKVEGGYPQSSKSILTFIVLGYPNFKTQNGQRLAMQVASWSTVLPVWYHRYSPRFGVCWWIGGAYGGHPILREWDWWCTKTYVIEKIINMRMRIGLPATTGVVIESSGKHDERRECGPGTCRQLGSTTGYWSLF